jgi:hypothetical protein
MEKSREKIMSHKRQRKEAARLEVLFQRKDQATIFRELVERHHNEIPVPALYECRAIRLRCQA